MLKKIFLLTVLLCVGLVAKDISTYLYADYIDEDSIKSKLSSQNFEVVGEYDAMNNPSYHIIIYTSKELKEIGNKKNRIFASVEKILIDKKNKKLVLTNPEYFIRAFMQDDLNQNQLNLITNKLRSVFHSLKDGDDKLDSDDLKGYHFMFGMPYYEDMIEVANGDNLEKILEDNNKDLIVFKIKNSNATLYGIKQHTENGEKYYINAIEQEAKSAFLPYMVMIQDNKAIILHPKYYLAISLPQLSMGEFMTISDAPDNIEDFFKKLFKQ